MPAPEPTPDAMGPRTADNLPYTALFEDVQLPEGGQRIYLRTNGEAVALFRWEGQVYALSNRCVHRGGSIGNGTFSAGIVTCPMHEWEFHIGDGRCVDNPDMGLRTYPVMIQENMIKVRFEDT